MAYYIDYIHYSISFLIWLIFGLRYTIFLNSVYDVLNTGSKTSKLILFGSLSWILFGLYNTLYSACIVLIYEYIMRDMQYVINDLAEEYEDNIPPMLKTVRDKFQDVYSSYLSRGQETNRYAIFRYYNICNQCIGYVIGYIRDIFKKIPYVNEIFNNAFNNSRYDEMIKEFNEKIPKQSENSIPDIEDIMKHINEGHNSQRIEDLFKKDDTNNLPTKDDINKLKDMVNMMDQMTNAMNLMNKDMNNKKID